MINEILKKIEVEISQLITKHDKARAFESQLVLMAKADGLLKAKEIILAKQKEPCEKTCDNCSYWDKGYTCPNEDFHYCQFLTTHTRSGFGCNQHSPLADNLNQPQEDTNE